MRTYIYVDGFNLYYGLIKGTPYKWLDLKSLFLKVLGNPYNIIKIKYFTANVSPRPGSPQAPIEQSIYLHALKAYIPEIHIILGHFINKTVTMPLKKPHIFGKKYAEVIKTEEKGSDVNLAVHLLNDGWLNKYDCAVVVSNDGDLKESLRLVRRHCRKRIILIAPGSPKRPPSNILKKFSKKTISIPEEALKSSQLPNPIPSTNLSKPASW